MDLNQLDYIKQLMGADFELLKDTYIRDNGNRLLDIDSAISANNLESVRKAAHTMKSSSANIGAVEVADLAARIEQCALEQSLDTIVNLYPQLIEAFENTKKVLNN